MNFLQYYTNSGEIIFALAVSSILLIFSIFFILVASIECQNKFKLVIKILIIISLPLIIVTPILLYEYYIKNTSLNEQKEIKSLIELTLNKQNYDKIVAVAENKYLKEKLNIIVNLNEDLTIKYYNYFKEFMIDDKITYGEFLNLKFYLLEQLNNEQLKINENENKQKNKKEEENILKELKEIKNYVLLPSKN